MKPLFPSSHLGILPALPTVSTGTSGGALFPVTSQQTDSSSNVATGGVLTNILKDEVFIPNTIPFFPLPSPQVLEDLDTVASRQPSQGRSLSDEELGLKWKGNVSLGSRLRSTRSGQRKLSVGPYGIKDPAANVSSFLKADQIISEEFDKWAILSPVEALEIKLRIRTAPTVSIQSPRKKINLTTNAQVKGRIDQLLKGRRKRKGLNETNPFQGASSAKLVDYGNDLAAFISRNPLGSGRLGSVGLSEEGLSTSANVTLSSRLNTLKSLLIANPVAILPRMEFLIYDGAESIAKQEIQNAESNIIKMFDNAEARIFGIRGVAALSAMKSKYVNASGSMKLDSTRADIPPTSPNALFSKVGGQVDFMCLAMARRVYQGTSVTGFKLSNRVSLKSQAQASSLRRLATSFPELAVSFVYNIPNTKFDRAFGTLTYIQSHIQRMRNKLGSKKALSAFFRTLPSRDKVLFTKAAYGKTVTPFNFGRSVIGSRDFTKQNQVTSAGRRTSVNMKNVMNDILLMDALNVNGDLLATTVKYLEWVEQKVLTAQSLQQQTTTTAPFVPIIPDTAPQFDPFAPTPVGPNTGSGQTLPEEDLLDEEECIGCDENFFPDEDDVFIESAKESVGSNNTLMIGIGIGALALVGGYLYMRNKD